MILGINKTVTGPVTEIWLVGYDNPGSETCVRLAKFPSQNEADIYLAALNQSMAFAREVGRSGLG
jgi:hypothetical protein